VGTRVGVLPELAPEAALAVAVGDSLALAEATSALIGDEPRRRAMGQVARQRAEAEFSIGGCAERFRQIYSELRR
jgi:glycosyltransferase involved in cell wall biosynthesis